MNSSTNDPFWDHFNSMTLKMAGFDGHLQVISYGLSWPFGCGPTPYCLRNTRTRNLRFLTLPLPALFACNAHMPCARNCIAHTCFQLLAQPLCCIRNATHVHGHEWPYFALAGLKSPCSGKPSLVPEKIHFGTKVPHSGTDVRTKVLTHGLGSHYAMLARPLANGLVARNPLASLLRPFSFMPGFGNCWPGKEKEAKRNLGVPAARPTPWPCEGM